VAVEDGMHAGLEGVGGVHGGEAEVEHHLQRAGDDVGGAGAGLDVGHLPGGGREVFVALVPHLGGEFGQGRGGEVDGVLGELRVGDVALHALHGELARQAAAAAVLDGVAEGGRGGGLADDAVVEGLAAGLEGFDDQGGAVGGVAFFVGGEQQGDGAGVPGGRRRRPRWR
jgi:hypothetical protein